MVPSPDGTNLRRFASDLPADVVQRGAYFELAARAVYPADAASDPLDPATTHWQPPTATDDSPASGAPIGPVRVDGG